MRNKQKIKTSASCDLGVDFLVPLPPMEQNVLMRSPDVRSTFSQRTRGALTWARRHSAEHIQPYKMVLTASDQMWVTPWLSDKTCGGGRCDSNAPQMWRFSVFNLLFHHLLTSNRLNNWSTDRSMREIIVGYHLQTVFALRLRWKYNITDFPFVLSPIFGYINLKLNKIERTPGSDRFWSCSAACEAEAHHIWIDHCSGSPNSFHPASIWVWLKRLQTLPLASRIISNTTNLSLNSRHFTGAVNTSSCRMDQVCVFGAVTGTYLLFVIFLPAVW